LGRGSAMSREAERNPAGDQRVRTPTRSAPGRSKTRRQGGRACQRRALNAGQQGRRSAASWDHDARCASNMRPRLSASSAALSVTMSESFAHLRILVNEASCEEATRAGRRHQRRVPSSLARGAKWTQLETSQARGHRGTDVDAERHAAVATVVLEAARLEQNRDEGDVRVVHRLERLGGTTRWARQRTRFHRRDGGQGRGGVADGQLGSDGNECGQSWQRGRTMPSSLHSKLASWTSSLTAAAEEVADDRQRRRRGQTAGSTAGRQGRTIEQLFEDRGLGETGFEHGGGGEVERRVKAGERGAWGVAQVRVRGGEGRRGARREMSSRATDAPAELRRVGGRVSAPAARWSRARTDRIACPNSSHKLSVQRLLSFGLSAEESSCLTLVQRHKVVRMMEAAGGVIVQLVDHDGTSTGCLLVISPN
jgi:hypothetical protein